MSIRKRPLITDKVSSLNRKGVYGFVVDNRANKIKIKQEVEQAYGVTVDKINTMRYAGKKRTRYTKSRVNQGRQASYKKAIVTLKAGEVIDFYGSIQ